MRVGGYSLEPALGTGMRIQLVGARASFSHEIREALSAPEQEPDEGVESPGPAEEAIEDAERVTGWVEQASSLVNSILAGKLLDRALVEAEARVGLALLKRLEHRRRFRDVVRVSRVLVSLLLLVLRWRDLVGVLRTALAAARELGDVAAEAWAQHELGTVALAGGDVEQAATRLESARELRGQLGDGPGRAATEANLKVLRAGRPGLKRLAVAGAAVIVIAVVAVVVVLLTRDDGPTPPPPPGAMALSVELAGDGDGTVTSSPGGISCEGTCSAEFPAGSDVVLEAAASEGSRFAGWSGAGCSGTGSCSVTLDAAQSVTATFEVEQAPPVALSVELAGDGAGTVTSSPGGISCEGTCSAEFPAGSDVVLEAAASEGSRFAGWSGAGCSGTGSCSVTLDAAQSVTATFEVEQAPPVALSVELAGDGAGTVTSSPGGISCEGTCSAEFPAGSDVVLEAAASEGSRFAGWSGAGCSGTGSCSVTLDAAQSVTATFEGAVE